MAFKDGDTVKLKSGGPIMTVINSDDESTACMWFDAKKQQTGVFPTVTLVEASPPRPYIGVVGSRR